MKENVSGCFFSEHSVVSTLFDVFLSLYNYVNIGVKSK